MTDTELPSVIASIAKEIDSTPVLSAEEERDLIARLKDDRPALNRALVLHNLAFALSQSNKYQEHSESREDMLLRALTGLVAAAEKFNPDQGVRFSTYAGYHIKLQFRELYDKNLAAVKTQKRTSAVFDAPFKPDDAESGSIGDVLARAIADPAYHFLDPAAELLRVARERELRDSIGYLIEKVIRPGLPRDLTEEQAAMIRDRLVGHTLEQIGCSTGVSKEWVRQIVEPAIKVVRKAVLAAPPYSELRRIVPHHDRPTPPAPVSPSDVSDFLSENRITVAEPSQAPAPATPTPLSPAEKRAADRRERLLVTFDLMEDYLRASMGEIGQTADFTALRRAYEAVTADRLSPAEASARLGLPPVYVRFLDDEAHRLIEAFRKKSYTSPPQTVPRETRRPKSKRIADKLASSASSLSTPCWTSRNAPLRKKRPPADLEWHAAPFRGNFYSEWSRYYRGASEIVMTPRHLAINIRLGNINPRNFVIQPPSYDRPKPAARITDESPATPPPPALYDLPKPPPQNPAEPPRTTSA